MRLLSWILLSLCLSTAAWAEDVPSAQANPPSAPEKPTLLPQPWDDNLSTRAALGLRAGRMGVEFLLGAGIGVPSEVVGAYAGLSVDVASGHEAGAGLWIGTAVGALGTAPGVWLGGRAMGGDGSFGWTLIGSAAGTGAAAGLLGIKSTQATLMIAGTLPIFGAMAGYEMSSHTRLKPAVELEPHRLALRVVPSIGPNSVGISGIF
ncbi:MAG: hypothetical protein JST54_01780 [Deltaproteobacteria bacterium]|nr:hypothetical protein [Deltaproteobacteria bacterium]